MRRWADKKGGYEATPDGFDRSAPDTLASLIDEWFRRLEERNYSPRTVEAHKWALRTFVRWAEERDLRAARTDHQADPGELSALALPLPQGERQAAGRDDAARPPGRGAERSSPGCARSNRLAANPAADLELPRKPHQDLAEALSLAKSTPS